MHVRDLMSRPAEWVNPAIPIREAARKMRELRIGCLPVGEGGRLLGIVTDRDLVCRAVADGRDADRTRVRDVMTRGVAYCFEDQSLLEAATIMRDRQVRRLPVLDRRERVVGILSVNDLCEGVPDIVFAATMRAVRDPVVIAVSA
jgi:CBS domain-containing protein